MKRTVLLAGLLVLAGCSGDTSSTEAVNTEQRSIMVFAASSLTGLLTDLAARYEQAHPDVTVSLSFGSSTTLAQQIAQGAPANVFVSASPTAMAAAGSRVATPINYLTNHVVVAVPAGATTPAESGTAILNSVTTWIQCAPEAPCGAVADKATAAFGVTTTPASLEPDVKSVVAKLLAGEVDAGIVYLTDVRATSGKLIAVEFGRYEVGSAQQTALTTQYAIGEVDQGDADAASFLAYLISAEGIRAATSLGFGPPPS